MSTTVPTAPGEKMSRHERAKSGATARWGPPRIVRLDELTGDQRALVVALVENMGTRKAAPAEANAGTATRNGGHGNGTRSQD